MISTFCRFFSSLLAQGDRGAGAAPPGSIGPGDQGPVTAFLNDLAARRGTDLCSAAPPPPQPPGYGAIRNMLIGPDWWDVPAPPPAATKGKDDEKPPEREQKVA